jgi:hypothetical protein
VIEAAATPPFFHNNSAATIEAAVAFFASPEFNVDPNNPIIVLNSDKATALAAFLRAIGATELIDRARGNNDAAIGSGLPAGRNLIGTAVANTKDAMKVLEEGVYLLFPAARKELAGALMLEELGLLANNPRLRNRLLAQANAKLASARAEIVE